MKPPADLAARHNPEQGRKTDPTLDRDPLTETNRGIIAWVAAFLANGAIRLASAGKGADEWAEGDTDAGSGEV